MWLLAVVHQLVCGIGLLSMSASYFWDLLSHLGQCIVNFIQCVMVESTRTYVCTCTFGYLCCVHLITDEGVYVDSLGELIKDTRLQWGEVPTSIGMFSLLFCEFVYLFLSYMYQECVVCPVLYQECVVCPELYQECVVCPVLYQVCCVSRVVSRMCCVSRVVSSVLCVQSCTYIHTKCIMLILYTAALIGDTHVMGWGNKGIEIRSVETGQMDGIFMHKKTQKLRFLCERNDKVS